MLLARVRAALEGDAVRFWTEDEKQFLRDSYGTMPVAEVAAALGRLERDVYTMRSKMDLCAASKKRPSRQKYLAVLAQECIKYRVSIGEAMGKKRTRKVCGPRFKAWARLVDEGYSLPGIAIVAGKDHTTILFGAKRASSPEFAYPEPEPEAVAAIAAIPRLVPIKPSSAAGGW